MESIVEFASEHGAAIIGVLALLLGVPGALLAVCQLRRRTAADPTHIGISGDSVQASDDSVVNVGSGLQAVLST